MAGVDPARFWGTGEWRENESVRVSVRQQGGLFGTDTKVEIEDDVVRHVGDDGKAVEKTLDAGTSKKVGKLVAKSVKAIDKAKPAAPAKGVYDSMTTTVIIEEDGQQARELTVASGDDVPAPVSELIDTVMRSPYPAKT